MKRKFTLSSFDWISLHAISTFFRSEVSALTNTTVLSEFIVLTCSVMVAAAASFLDSRVRHT